MCVCTKPLKHAAGRVFYKQKITIGGKFVAVRKPILTAQKAGTVSAQTYGPSSGVLKLPEKISRVYERKKI
jgi:hypothetical protein